MAPDTLSYEDSLSMEGGARSFWLVRAMQSAKPLEAPLVIELPAGSEVRLGRGTRGVFREQEGARPVVHVQTDDERMSTSHARLVQRSGAWTLLDSGSKNGTFANGKRVSAHQLEDGDLLEIGGTMMVYRCGSADTDLALARDAVGAALPVLATAAPALAEQFALLDRVAASAIPILVQGETGTGKELAARAAHQLSGRAGPFVAVNCGALPTTLVESQLFGFTRGAFSGADRDSAGLVRAADQGTLFLDEIAELSEASQVALLRVLQEREVLPVGATAPISVDVRVVAATHRHLESWIADGRFREDLYARIAGAVIRLEPLRERKEDLGLLVATLLRELGGDDAASVRFTRKAMRLLFAYDWPRNVRELRSALALALTGREHGPIKEDHLPATVTAGPAPKPAPAAAAAPAREPTREAIVDALRQEGGNVSAAARRAGYSRAHFNRLLKRLAIDPGEYRS